MTCCYCQYWPGGVSCTVAAAEADTAGWAAGGATFPPGALALENQVQDQDYDDGQDYHHGGAEPQNVLDLQKGSAKLIQVKNSIVYVYVRNIFIANLFGS